ncbi:MAG: DUF167 domain-containing protein [Acidobacteriaceae bacterium]|nr:DUF167 domain-containing protein [Acidobacteriaceae bacterium]
MSALPVSDSKDGALFSVRVHPGARKSGITSIHADALKVSLSTPPVDGRANEALIEFVAEWLGVARAAVAIVSGQHARSKRVCVAGVSAATVQAAVERSGIRG